MFPGVDGFHWSAGHIIFLAIFFSVLTVIAVTVSAALFRTAGALRRNRVEQIRWHTEFEDLPARDRACRHELTGEVAERTCHNGFDCRACKEHPKFARNRDEAANEHSGLLYPSWRYYHRGHTWVEPLADGTLAVGLDEIGTRIIGEPDRVELPAPGTQLTANGAGWRIHKRGVEVRILAPVEGEVLETGGPDRPWYLRVKPRAAKPDLRHLLHGSEVGAWVRRELDRFARLAAPPDMRATMADGGVLIHDAIAAQPAVKWDAVVGEVFLEP